MKYVVALLMVLSMAVSCKKEVVEPNKNTCGVVSPTTELDWLKQEIARRDQDTTDIKKYFYIQQGVYHGQTVFLYNNCCPYCSTIILAYTCEGELINKINLQEVTDTKVIWAPVDFECQI